MSLPQTIDKIIHRFYFKMILNLQSNDIIV